MSLGSRPYSIDRQQSITYSTPNIHFSAVDGKFMKRPSADYIMALQNERKSQWCGEERSVAYWCGEERSVAYLVIWSKQGGLWSVCAFATVKAVRMIRCQQGLRSGCEFVTAKYVWVRKRRKTEINLRYNIYREDEIKCFLPWSAKECQDMLNIDFNTKILRSLKNYRKMPLAFYCFGNLFISELVEISKMLLLQVSLNLVWQDHYFSDWFRVTVIRLLGRTCYPCSANRPSRRCLQNWDSKKDLENKVWHINNSKVLKIFTRKKLF